MTKKAKTTKTRKAAAARPSAGAGIRRSELESIRKTLTTKREEIIHTMRKNQELETTPEVGDEADQAGLSIEKELIFELSDNERTTLDQIEGALRKLDKGNYGLCESCQKPIGRQRIKALPFARYCIACQGSSERAVVA